MFFIVNVFGMEANALALCGGAEYQAFSVA